MRGPRLSVLKRKKNIELNVPKKLQINSQNLFKLKKKHARFKQNKTYSEIHFLK